MTLFTTILCSLPAWHRLFRCLALRLAYFYDLTLARGFAMARAGDLSADGAGGWWPWPSSRGKRPRKGGCIACGGSVERETAAAPDDMLETVLPACDPGLAKSGVVVGKISHVANAEIGHVANGRCRCVCYTL
jgi:hypothetical protein